jgi:hypothetical protein
VTLLQPALPPTPPDTIRGWLNGRLRQPGHRTRLQVPGQPAKIWADWECQKQEQFGDRWKTALAVVATFEQFGIFLLDISPSNIAFAS